LLIRLFDPDYTAMITLLSLFAASVHVPFRRRARAFALWAFPLTFFTQTIFWAFRLRSRGFLSPFEESFVENARSLVLPVFAWIVWVVFAAPSRPRRSQAAPRRQGRAD
jgi:hypothetical protein